MPPQQVIYELLLWKSATGNKSWAELDWTNESQASLLTADKCTKVIYLIHGWMENLELSGFMRETRDGKLISTNFYPSIYYNICLQAG